MPGPYMKESTRLPFQFPLRGYMEDESDAMALQMALLAISGGADELTMRFAIDYEIPPNGWEISSETECRMGVLCFIHFAASGAIKS